MEATLSLADDKLAPQALTIADQRRGLRLLTPKERSLLRLAYDRGASLGELAGVMGVSRGAVRRMLRRARRRATDPENMAILRCWRRLTEPERRLVRLNRFWGLSLRHIVRDGLVTAAAAEGAASRPATLWDLRSMMRSVLRKVRRGERRRKADPPLSPCGRGVGGEGGVAPSTLTRSPAATTFSREGRGTAGTACRAPTPGAMPRPDGQEG